MYNVCPVATRRVPPASVTRNYFWCFPVLYSYQRQMTNHCLPFPLLFEALWQSLRSKAGRELLPLQLGGNSRVPGLPFPLSSPQSRHWEYQGPRKCVWIHSSYLWLSWKLPSLAFLQETFHEIEGHFGSNHKLQINIRRNIFPMTIYSLWMGMFSSVLLHMVIFH